MQAAAHAARPQAAPDHIGTAQQAAAVTPGFLRLELSGQHIAAIEQCIDEAAAVGAQPLADIAPLLRQHMARPMYEALQSRLMRAVTALPEHAQAKPLHAAVRQALAYEDIDNSAVCNAAYCKAERAPEGDHLIPVFENFLIIPRRDYVRFYRLAESQTIFRPPDLQLRMRAALTRSLQLVPSPQREELFEDQRAYANILRAESRTADLDCALAHIGTKLNHGIDMQEALFKTFAGFAFAPGRTLGSRAISDLCQGAKILRAPQNVDEIIALIESRVLRAHSERADIYAQFLPLVWKTTPEFRDELVPRICGAMRFDEKVQADLIEDAIFSRFHKLSPALGRHAVMALAENLAAQPMREGFMVFARLPSFVAQLPHIEAVQALHAIVTAARRYLPDLRMSFPVGAPSHSDVSAAQRALQAAVNVRSYLLEAAKNDASQLFSLRPLYRENSPEPESMRIAIRPFLP